MIPEVKNSSAAWMNYALCISTGVVIPFVFLTTQNKEEKILEDSHIFEKNEIEKPMNRDKKVRSTNIPYQIMD